MGVFTSHHPWSAHIAFLVESVPEKPDGPKATAWTPPNGAEGRIGAFCSLTECRQGHRRVMCIPGSNYMESLLNLDVETRPGKWDLYILREKNWVYVPPCGLPFAISFLWASVSLFET